MKVAVQMLAILLPTRQVPGSNLYPKAGVLTGYHVFSRLLEVNALTRPLTGH
jgi:hypothetical protein